MAENIPNVTGTLIEHDLPNCTRGESKQSNLGMKSTEQTSNDAESLSPDNEADPLIKNDLPILAREKTIIGMKSADPRSNDVKNLKPKDKGLIKPKKKPTHPPSSVMVVEAIRSLKARKGASAQAILKYIDASYTIDMKYMKTYIKRFLNNCVNKGMLERVSKVGVPGRFKIMKNFKDNER